MVQLIVAEHITLSSSASNHAGGGGIIGEALMCSVVATDKGEHVFRRRGQEASIWNLRLVKDKTYFIIPSTARSGLTNCLFY
jgi:hypothetical protein